MLIIINVGLGTLVALLFVILKGKISADIVI